MELMGTLMKMKSKVSQPIQYELPIGKELLQLNPLIGSEIKIEHTGRIFCISCGKKTRRSFAQGFCYPCFQTVPETSECILRPELCRAQEGEARDMAWAKEHCLQDHVVYLAISSGIKVGVTRRTQVPTRWIDQGASYALSLAITPNRYTAGLLEVALKEYVGDRTQWQRMLKNEIADDIDLLEQKEMLSNKLPKELQKHIDPDGNLRAFEYPVLDYPTKVKSLSLDKLNTISGHLAGIKGQYFLFDDGRVFNVRKHQGYEIVWKT